MNYWDIRREISKAKGTLENADSVATEAARIIEGRLRKVSPDVLAKLKSELRNFNAKTYEWKN